MIPPDKLRHAGIGVLVAVFALLLWMLAALAGLAPLAGAPAALALAGIVAGLTKEGADWLDNRITPGMHGVELLDAVATALPGLVLGLLAHQVINTTGLP